MSTNWIAMIVTFDSIWLVGLMFYVYSWIKTRTWPFELSDDELVKRVFGGNRRNK